jgi:hypothetical protein
MASASLNGVKTPAMNRFCRFAGAGSNKTGRPPRIDNNAHKLQHDRSASALHGSSICTTGMCKWVQARVSSFEKVPFTRRQSTSGWISSLRTATPPHTTDGQRQTLCQWGATKQ